MTAFDPRILAADCGGEWRGKPVAPIAGFSHDTRVISGGEIFIALRTAKRDGHDFIGDAAKRGACAALVERHVPDSPLPQLVVPDTLKALHAMAAAHRRRFTGPVVGVTGSAGKTSTKDLLALLLAAKRDVLATEGNLNNHLGVPLTLLRIDPARHRAAVIEAGISAPGEMDVLARLIQPDVAVVTNVSAAHLDGLGTLDRVAEEKARLLVLGRSQGVGIFPSGCLAYRAFLSLQTDCLVAVVAGSPVGELPARARAVPYAVLHEGRATRLCVTWHGSVEEFDLRRVSAGMAGNAALAITVALHLGVGAGAIRKRIAAWKPAAMRGELVKSAGCTVYLDCYNANPASMADALESFAACTPEQEPRLFVVGCMDELGTDSAALHRTTGQQWPVRTGDRMMIFGAQADALADGVRTHASWADILVNPDRERAARILREFRGAIFLKGSRRYALETLLDGGLSHHQAHGKGDAAAC